MTLSVRFAGEADIPALVELRLAIDDDQARRFGTDRYSTTINGKSVARELASSRVLVACANGRIVGELRMARKKPWAIDLRYFTPVAKAIYLHGVHVHSNMQRSGIGPAKAGHYVRERGHENRCPSCPYVVRLKADTTTKTLPALRALRGQDEDPPRLRVSAVRLRQRE